MRIVKTHTGKIYVDKDKELEFLTVGDYGKENNIKASFLGLNKEIKRTCGVKNICYPNFKKWALDNGYSTLTKLANDMDMCSSLVRSLLIKGEPPTKRSIRKITEFTGMSADEVFYLPDVAA